MKDEILAYTDGEAYPFHMPGHKRNISDGLFPYKLDLTEIDGFDNLHRPEGFIKGIEDKAARIYHAQRAFLLVNGATGGILSAIKASTSRGDKIIVARNCHTSVYHAAELLGLRAEYILPEPATDDIYGRISPTALERQLADNPGVSLVIITSPTYEGICSDIKEIAQICHSYGAKLFVDEAHGAHFTFHSAFPQNAMQCGADIAVVSLHKTMPALTQTALLLTSNREMVQPLQSALAFFQTSSPSYVLMSSIENCLTEKWDFDGYINRIHRLENSLRELNNLKLLFRGQEDYDFGKLVISTQNAGISGIELADILRKRYNIEVEMSANGYIIAMTSVCDTDCGFDRLKNALLKIDLNCSGGGSDDFRMAFELPERRLFPFEITRTKAVDFKEAQGMISAEDIFAYPPGIPIIVKGEVLSAELIGYITALRGSNVNIISSADSYPESILIADL